MSCAMEVEALPGIFGYAVDLCHKVEALRCLDLRQRLWMAAPGRTCLPWTYWQVAAAGLPSNLRHRSSGPVGTSGRAGTGQVTLSCSSVGPLKESGMRALERADQDQQGDTQLDGIPSSSSRNDVTAVMGKRFRHGRYRKSNRRPKRRALHEAALASPRHQLAQRNRLLGAHRVHSRRPVAVGSAPSSRTGHPRCRPIDGTGSLARSPAFHRRTCRGS
jgi:hypothetical protein